MSEQPFRIGQDDLFSPQVEDYLETQAQLMRTMDEIEEQSWFTKLIYANWLYLAFWGMIGALIGWGLLEPFFDDQAVANEQLRPGDGQALLAALLLFPTVAAGVGLFLGAAEGLMCRNISRAFLSGLVGIGVGFLGGIVALIPTVIVFGTIKTVAQSLMVNNRPFMALFVLMMGRAMAWSIVSIPAGLGHGIAIRERKVIINGLLGGVMGGFLGGLMFDPIDQLLNPGDGRATLSRGVGFAAIGLVVGLLTGLVEGWTKTAWLLMKKGPLAGKQFILYKDTTILGSSPKAEIYLFKDDAIEPRHVVIHNRGGRFEIEDCNTPDGTYVNGVPIKKTYLQAGDQIVLGKTVLEFALREAKN